MKISVANRLTLLGVLPEKGTFVTLKIVRKLREELSLSEEEIKAIELRQDGDRVFWNQDADSMKDIQIGDKATDIVVDSLKALDKAGQLTQQHMWLCEQFLGE